MTTISYDTIRAVIWQNGQLNLLDQRHLPQEESYLQYQDATDVADAIRNMVVRGAPAIGITAAYAVVLAARKAYALNPTDWRNGLESDLQRLAASRPTAVNLFWALDRMREAMHNLAGDPEPSLLATAMAIHDQDIAANRRIGEFGAALIEGPAVLTHCNAGALATGGYGTALGVIRSAFTAGRIERVYADETRPWLQGARLTAWELLRDGIPTTLLCEGAAASLLQTGQVNWVVVGADRIAMNGDVANKIGTYGLAILARHHGVKFMVAAPVSTIDRGATDGSAIPIEQRPEREVLTVGGQAIAPGEANAWNPAFDVTPAALIDAIVTERGVVEQPNEARMKRLLE